MIEEWTSAHGIEECRIRMPGFRPRQLQQRQRRQRCADRALADQAGMLSGALSRERCQEHSQRAVLPLLRREASFCR
jgi:hypothetical protein